MIQTETTIQVRYVETDQMGFVHHQNYVAYFELARVDMLEKIGVPYHQLEKDGYMLPVLGVEIQYLMPNTFGDELRIVCIMREMPKVRINIEYEIFRGETLTTTGSSHHGFMSPKGKAIRPPKYLIEAARPFYEK